MVVQKSQLLAVKDNSDVLFCGVVGSMGAIILCTEISLNR